MRGNNLICMHNKDMVFPLTDTISFTFSEQLFQRESKEQPQKNNVMAVKVDYYEWTCKEHS